jgi:hypothetical protein
MLGTGTDSNFTEERKGFHMHVRLSRGCRSSMLGGVVWVWAVSAISAEVAYIKAPNPDVSDQFGFAVAISRDTMVAGAPFEQSGGKDGAAYVFVRRGGGWEQQAYLKASNLGWPFGWSVAISGDTIVVGAPSERSAARGVDGNQNDTSIPEAGAAYVFVRSGTNWSQQAYLKASNTEAGDQFGRAVAIFGDTIVVGAPFESSNATGVNGDQSDNSALAAGAVYVFARQGTNWTQQAYVKGSNTAAIDQLGSSVSVYENRLVAGARGQDEFSGAAYVFARNGTTWTQEAFLKASNASGDDYFGESASIWADTIVVGAPGESSTATGTNGQQSASGAAYVFVRSGTSWIQQAFLKAFNAEGFDSFGGAVGVSGDTIVVGAQNEGSSATGVHGDGGNNGAPFSGAGYVFVREGTTWGHRAYLKASNTQPGAAFGRSAAIFGEVVMVGAPGEGNYSGAVYGFTGLNLPALDSDKDGVPDAADECPDTSAGAVVDARGCSIEQLAPCHGPWRNHAQYLGALREVTTEFVVNGLIDERQQRAILLQGAKSGCGKRP